MNRILPGKIIFDENRHCYTIDPPNGDLSNILIFDNIIFVVGEWNYISNPDCQAIYYILMSGHNYYFFKYHNRIYEGYPIDTNEIDIASYIFKYDFLHEEVRQNNMDSIDLMRNNPKFPMDKNYFQKYIITISTEIKRKLNEDFNHFRDAFLN